MDEVCGCVEFVFISAEQVLKRDGPIRFPSLWLPVLRKADGPAMCLRDWPVSVLSRPDAAVIWRDHANVKRASEKLPSNGAPSNLRPS